MNIQYIVVDLLFMGQPTKSASKYPIILVFPLSLYNNPCPRTFCVCELQHSNDQYEDFA